LSCFSPFGVRDVAIYFLQYALSRKKADVFDQMFDLLDPVRTIYDDLEEMVDKATPRTPVPRDGDQVTHDTLGPELARLSHKLSETLTAVSAAADRLHDIAEEQAQVRPCGASMHCCCINHFNALHICPSRAGRWLAADGV